MYIAQQFPHVSTHPASLCRKFCKASVPPFSIFFSLPTSCLLLLTPHSFFPLSSISSHLFLASHAPISISFLSPQMISHSPVCFCLPPSLLLSNPYLSVLAFEFYPPLSFFLSFLTSPLFRYHPLLSIYVSLTLLNLFFKVFLLSLYFNIQYHL